MVACEATAKLGKRRTAKIAVSPIAGPARIVPAMAPLSSNCTTCVSKGAASANGEVAFGRCGGRRSAPPPRRGGGGGGGGAGFFLLTPGPPPPPCPPPPARRAGGGEPNRCAVSTKVAT